MSGQDNRSSDSDTNYYSADEDLVEGKPLTTPSRRSRSKEASPEVKAKLYNVNKTEDTSLPVPSSPPEAKPVPPPRRKRKALLVKQASAEETAATNEVNLSEDDLRRVNTFSWPRGERPSVQDYPTDSSSLTTARKTERIHSHTRPSISIEDTNLEFTEEMMDEPQKRVESNDGLLIKAVDTREKVKSIVVYNSEDEESVDGDVLLTDGAETIEGEDREMGGVKEKPEATGVEPSDSQILEETLIKNLDTGEKFPLSLAEKKIPLPKVHDPIIGLCEERATEQLENWDANEDNDCDSEGPASKKKTKKKRFKKLFGKEKKKGESRPLSSGSDDEASPEHDYRTIKYKAASHNKGTLDFEKVRLKQELRHSMERSKAIWVMEFSVCGRLLATAGQDSVVRVWVLRSAYPFFHELQQKYARIGVHSSADSLSERSSLNSTETEDYSTGTAPFLENPICSYTGHSADVLDLSWSKNFFLLSSSMDKTVRLWHISRSECLCCFQHVDFVTAIAFHPRDDRYFLSGSLDGKLRLWNIPDKKVALWNELEGVGSHLITAANFCMNGKLAVAGTYDGRCIFYETEHLKYHTQIHVRSRHGKNRGRKISGIEPLPGEDKILVTSNDSRVRLYNLKDHSLSCKYKGCLNTSSQIRASFSRDGRYIVCGSEDSYIYVWKTHHDHSKLSSARRDRNDCYESFTTHSAVVTAVTFAPVPGMTVDKGLQEIGEVIVAGDYHGHIRVYVNSDDL